MLCLSCGQRVVGASFCHACGSQLVVPVSEPPPPSHCLDYLPELVQVEAPATLTSPTFVGRQREMGELKAALEDACSGHGRLAMLAGEPGIGKTRTAQELASQAEAKGAQVLWGWCYEEQGAATLLALGPAHPDLCSRKGPRAAVGRNGPRRR